MNRMQQKRGFLSVCATFNPHPGSAPASQRVAAGAGPLTEIRRLFDLARHNLSSGRRPWLALTLSATTVVVYALLPYPAIGTGLWHSGAVYAALPLPTELWRLPMSLFLPTPYLPVWGAAAQLMAVLGLGELLLGRWLTIGIATFGHVAATLTARLLVGGVLGLAPELAHVLDTGPSAAATAVGAYLLVVLGMHRCTTVLCAALFIAAVVAPGIDGVEHLVALAFGLLAGHYIPARLGGLVSRPVGAGTPGPRAARGGLPQAIDGSPVFSEHNCTDFG
jgi:hypothetical protein